MGDKKKTDEFLFRDASPEARKLNAQARKEKRLQLRKQYKDKYLTNE